MKYEGVSFNAAWVLKTFDTAVKFAAHKPNKHLWPALTETKRKERLREVYGLIKNANRL